MEKCRARSPHPETGFGNGFVAVVEILFYFLRQRLYPARSMTVQDAVSNIEKWKSIARSLTLLLALAAINPCAQATEISPDVDAVFGLYCYNCHDDLVQKGEVDLIALPELDQDARLELLNRIEEQIYLSQMPPKDKEQPTATENEQLLYCRADIVLKTNICLLLGRTVLKTNNFFNTGPTLWWLKDQIKSMLGSQFSRKVHGRFAEAPRKRIFAG